MTKENIKKFASDSRLSESAEKAKCSEYEFFRRICMNAGIKNASIARKDFS